MDYVLAGFSVFFIMYVAEQFLTMPRWAWLLSQCALSIVAWCLVPNSPIQSIWKALAIAGVVTIIKRLDSLLLVTSDRATVDILRSRR